MDELDWLAMCIDWHAYLLAFQFTGFVAYNYRFVVLVAVGSSCFFLETVTEKWRARGISFTVT